MQWFEDWFNSTYYHTLYKHRDDKEAEFFIQNLLNSISLQSNDKVLDLACGKGRHSVFLQKLGFDVIGMDLAEESIEFAKQFENERLHFTVGDMRTVYFPEHFDAVFNLFTSFGYFDEETDNAKVLHAIYTQLKADGIFVFDYFNDAYVTQNLLPFEEKTIDGITFAIRKTLTKTHILKDIDFEDNGKSYHFQEKVQRISAETMQQSCEKLGFEILQTFGNYALEPYHTIHSPRYIQIAQKIGK